MASSNQRIKRLKLSNSPARSVESKALRIIFKFRKNPEVGKTNKKIRKEKENV
jgi:hypothetical protein